MFGAILGSALSAGVSSGVSGLIGGLFGKKKKKTSNSVDYQALVRNAEAAGFNPLTALRNGGSAGFTQTHHPVLSSGEYIGRAVGDGLASAFAAADPHRQKTAELEQSLMEAKLDLLQNENTILEKGITSGRYDRQSFNVPTAQAPTVVHSSKDKSLYDGRPETPEKRGPEITNPYRKETGFVVDPTAPNASAYEERYGDVAQEVGGAYTLWRDLKKNTEQYNQGKTWEDWQRQSAILSRINYAHFH